MERRRKRLKPDAIILDDLNWVRNRLAAGSASDNCVVNYLVAVKDL